MQQFAMKGEKNVPRRCISGLVVEYIVAIDVTRVRFPADAFCFHWLAYISVSEAQIRGVAGLWRNGSASDSRSDGWAFESLWPHSLGSDSVWKCQTSTLG